MNLEPEDYKELAVLFALAFSTRIDMQEIEDINSLAIVAAKDLIKKLDEED